MRTSWNPGRLTAPLMARMGVTRLQRDESGTTAIEFAMVSLPFLMFVFGIIGIAFNFFIMNSLDKGMDNASRLVRTGQAQNSGMTVNQFKQKICEDAGAGATASNKWIACSKLQVFVQKYPDWQSIAPQPCVNASGQAVTNSASGSDQIAQYSGASSDIVLVTACYKWEMTSKLPFLRLGNMPDGAMMMQSATAFRSEPYTPAAP